MFALMPWTRRPALLPQVEISDDLDTLFDQLLTIPATETPEWPNRWGLTTEENDKGFLIRFELPGFELPEVKVEVIGDRLMIEAEHKPPEVKTEERTERSYSHVKRTITLPPAANLETVAATYRNGTLEVHVPRAPEALGRRIEVKT
jgi:HSP20 family molecular chaperone IbpA